MILFVWGTLNGHPTIRIAVHPGPVSYQRKPAPDRRLTYPVR
jgi:hypothetical protein